MSTPQTNRLVKKSTQKKVSRTPTTQNLFVACLPREVTNAQLLALFQPFGAKSATVMMNTAGRSKGFGFVIFDSADEGAVAMEAMNSKPISTPENPQHAFQLRCSPSNFNAKAVVTESQFVFVRNIPASIPMSQLRRLFGVYGEVKNIVCRSDEHSTSTHHKMVILMIEYTSVEDARDAIDAVHGVAMFPDYTSATLMAKFADTPTVKSYQRALRRGSTPQVRSLRSGNSTPQADYMHMSHESPATASLELDSPSAGSNAGSHHFQLPRCFSLDSNATYDYELGSQTSGPEIQYGPGSHSNDYMGLSDYEFPSGGASRRDSADTDYSTTDETGYYHDRRMSVASNQSLSHQASSEACVYRNDPYHMDGYVRVSPSSPALSH